MTPRRIIALAATLPAAFGVFLGYGIAVAWQRIKQEMPAVVLYLDERYPETETL